MKKIFISLLFCSLLFSPIFQTDFDDIYVETDVVFENDLTITMDPSLVIEGDANNLQNGSVVCEGDSYASTDINGRWAEDTFYGTSLYYQDEPYYGAPPPTAHDTVILTR